MLSASPDAAVHSLDPLLQSDRWGPTMVPPSVLGRVGESFAGALSTLRRRLATLGPLAPDQQDVLTVGLAEIARLEHLGVQIQEVARVLSGDVPVPSERVDLSRAAHEAFAHWTQLAVVQSKRLEVSSDPFALDVNAAVLEQLLDLGLEYALHVGSNIEIEAAMHGNPEHPVLSIRTQRSANPADVDAGFVELHWLLFANLARAIGLAPQRLVKDQTITLNLGFRGPDTAKVPDGPHGSAEVSHTASVVGRHVLLIEPQEMVRVHAHRLLRDAGMRVDAVAGIGQARTSLRDGSPEMIVTGVSVDDASCRALIDDACAVQPRLRVVQLVDDDDAFSFSVPGSNRPARVGRHELERTLVSAVSQELDAAWAG